MFNPSEVWKPIPGHAGYEASDHGSVRSVDRAVLQRDARGRVYQRRFVGKLLKPRLNKKHNYWAVKVTDEITRHYDLRVAHAVLFAFVGERPPGLEACHNDGDPANNAVENLRWDTRAGNAADTILHGTSTRGERHPMVKLSAAEVAAIRDSAESADALSKIYGVGKNHIYKIRTQRTWAWL